MSYHNSHGQPAETEMIYHVANYSEFFKQQKVITPSISGISVPRYFKIFIDEEGILRFHFRSLSLSLSLCLSLSLSLSHSLSLSVSHTHHIHTHTHTHRADNHVDSTWLQQPSPSRELTIFKKLADAADNYASFPDSSFRLSGTDADDAHGSGTSATPVYIYTY